MIGTQFSSANLPGPFKIVKPILIAVEDILPVVSLLYGVMEDVWNYKASIPWHALGISRRLYPVNKIGVTPFSCLFLKEIAILGGKLVRPGAWIEKQR